MGMFDDMAGKAFESLGFGGGGNANLLNTVLSMLANKESGGLSSMVKGFQEKGLGDIVSSWISTGKNLPISADQLRSGIGEDKISEIARQTGMSSEDVSLNLKDLLPNLIDKITPDGQMPEENLLEKGLDILKGKL